MKLIFFLGKNIGNDKKLMTVHGSISPDRGLKCVLVKNTCIQE